MQRSKWWIVSAMVLLAASGCTTGDPLPSGSPSSTIPGFELAWSFDAGSPTSVPAVDADTVYVSARDGRVFALPMDCGGGGTPCTPDWTGDTGSVLVQTCCQANYEGIPTQYLPPVVADELVFVVSGPKDPRTFAFDLECGADGTTCDPAWVEDGVAPLPLLTSDGFLYEVKELKDRTFAAYRTVCARDGSTCDPEWVAPNWWWPTVADGVLYNGTAPRAYDAATGSLLWAGAGAGPEGSLCTPPLTQAQECSIPGVPTVGEGVVVTHTMTGFAGTRPSTLYAYDATGCATDGDACAPLWTARTSDLFLSSQQLAITHGRVFVGTEIGTGSGTGHVLAYETDCRTDGGPCEPSLEVLVPDGEVAVLSPITAGDQVLFTSLEQGFVEGFAADAGVDGSSSEPLWRTPMMYGPARPVVADGVAYVADSSGNLFAFDIACSTSGETCHPIARYQASSGVVLPPVVANGYVFAGTQGGELLAFVAPRTS